MPAKRGVGPVPFLRSPLKEAYSLQSHSPDSAGLIRQTGSSLSLARAGKQSGVDMDAYRTALEPMLVDLKSEVIDRHFSRKLDPGNLKR